MTRPASSTFAAATRHGLLRAEMLHGPQRVLDWAGDHRAAWARWLRWHAVRWAYDDAGESAAAGWG